MKLLLVLPLLAAALAAQNETAPGSIAYEEDFPPYPMTIKFQEFLGEMKDLVSRVEQDKGLNWTHVAMEITHWRNRAKWNAKKWEAEISAKGKASSSATGATTPATSGTATGVPANGEAQVNTPSPTTTLPGTTPQTTGIPVSYSPPALTPVSGLPAPTTTSATTSSTAQTSPSTSPTTSAGTAGTEDTADQALFLSLHNNFRKQYGASPVIWNDTLAAYAYSAASTCKYGHTSGPYGENIAAGVGGGYDVTKGFGTWSNEYKLYNWNQPGYSEATGHFTQIVWKATTQIGCAAATCADGTIFTGYGQKSTYLVCEYAEPGNWVDPSSAANTATYFTQNVGTAQ